MRIIIFLTTSLAISFLTATPATTESYLPSQILSEGATTCGEFTTQAEMQASRMEWVLGYISGINAGIALRGETSAAERLAVTVGAPCRCTSATRPASLSGLPHWRQHFALAPLGVWQAGQARSTPSYSVLAATSFPGGGI